MSATPCGVPEVLTATDCYSQTRRGVDAVVALCGLVMLSPLLLAIAVVLRWTGERRVWFMQERVGQSERRFVLAKFVTMRTASEDTGTITRNDDPNVLPVGRVLRATKLNELPQLWNVFRGDMALVGPRPLPPVSFRFFPGEVRPVVSAMKPGLTGIGSLFFHDEDEVLFALGKDNLACYQEDIMPLKGALEIWYRQHRSAWVDLKIVAASVISLAIPHSRFFVQWFAVESILRDSSLRAYFLSR